MAKNSLLDKLCKESAALTHFATHAKSEPSLLVEGLWGGAKAALIALIAQATGKHLLVISPAADDKLLSDIAAFSDKEVIDFPSWETLPGDEISPSLDLVGKRLETLGKLHRTQSEIVLCSLQAALQKLPQPSSLTDKCRIWNKGDALPFSSLPQLLESLGYHRVPVVTDKGEFAVRGGMIDFFPLSSPDPFRLEFFGDVLEEIRTFDPISQRSTGKVESLFLTPASELDLLTHEKSLSTLFDYLGPATIVIFNDLSALEDKAVELLKQSGAQSRYFLPFKELLELSTPLQCHFWSRESLETLSSVKLKKQAGRSFYAGEGLQELTFEVFGASFVTKRWQHPFISLPDFFSLSENEAAATPDEVLHSLSRHAASLELDFLCSTEAEEKRLQGMLVAKEVTLPAKTRFLTGYLSSGFILERYALFPMTELTHRYPPRRQKWRSTTHTPASEFHELIPGDLVVHFHNGIGKYLGIEKHLNHSGIATEFMSIGYANESKLFVPLSQSHLISRYIGAKEELPTLSQLGTPRWQKTRVQAQQAITGYADQLLRMSAERTVKGGTHFPPDSSEMEMFEADFPFKETDDQLHAISALKKDLESPKAMDRLICGDVGYGKTEVAMRAAFKAVDGGKQVAVLVPTTLLAMQHYESFCARMANFPVRIGSISRFRTAKEVRETLKKTAEGTIDILIGTHRLISKDVIFKDLGLIIIDEEQRFGVRAKEHLRSLKAGVDSLTLSATPIPRTLYMTLIGAKEISTINTPPQDRLPIKTIIAPKESHLIRNALMRELARDGQAFFIHNRVETLPKVTQEIQALLPEARIVSAHGQMEADELDAVFHSFKSGQADILVSTVLIENGIDIPNANTILIDRADTFGLADLYQMRGRVGRWNRPAYAYFLIPAQRELSEISRRRLHAIAEASGFGAGMKLAMRDLEIRGAGNILGTEQSGQVSSIGFHLYCKLLKRTIEALKSGSSPTFTETKLECAKEASLPEYYINETSLRMEIYHRLGEALTVSEIDEIIVELKDRFGPYPEEVAWLHHLSRLRLFASQHHFTLIKCEKLTFYAERQSGKTIEKKTLALPRSSKPAPFEAQMITALKEGFKL